MQVNEQWSICVPSESKLFKSTFEKSKCAYVPANVDVSDLTAQQHFLIWRANTEISPQSGLRARRKCT